MYNEVNQIKKRGMNMHKRIEDMLNTVADMQKCIAPDDALSDMISAEDDELSEAELEFAAAARGIPSYAVFLRRAGLKDSDKK